MPLTRCPQIKVGLSRHDFRLLGDTSARKRQALDSSLKSRRFVMMSLSPPTTTVHRRHTTFLALLLSILFERIRPFRYRVTCPTQCCHESIIARLMNILWWNKDIIHRQSTWHDMEAPALYISSLSFDGSSIRMPTNVPFLSCLQHCTVHQSFPSHIHAPLHRHAP